MGHSRDQTLTWLSWGRPPGAAAARGRCRRRHGGLRNRDAGSRERSLQTPAPLSSLQSSLLSILTLPRPRGRPQPNPPGPARAHLKRAFHLRFSSTQISRRRHRWLRPQRRPTNRDSVLARPRPRKAPLCSDRGNWTASQDTYAQLARRSPSRMVFTATGTRFRGKSVEAAFRAFLQGGAGRDAGREGNGFVPVSLGIPNDRPQPDPRYQGLAVAPDPSPSLSLSASGSWSPPTRHLSSASISGGRADGFLTLPKLDCIVLCVS